MARILVVDDDAHIREVVRFALEKAGHQVSEAADGRAALAEFAASSADLVVQDLAIAGMPGCKLYVSWNLEIPLVNTNGTADWAMALPNDVSLLGSVAYQQATVLDPTANATGVVFSNAGEVKVGR